MHLPVTAPDGTEGWILDERGAPGGQQECLVANIDDATWHYDTDLTVRPAPPPREPGNIVRIYGQVAEILAYDAETDTYDMAAGLIVPPRFQRFGCTELGFVAAVHRYPRVPSAHLAVWDGE